MHILGKTFCSQLISFWKLRNKRKDLLFRAKLIHYKLNPIYFKYFEENPSAYVGNSINQNSSNLTNFTVSHHVHPFRIKNHKNCCHLNIVLQYSRTTDHSWKFENRNEGPISNVYLTQLITHPVHMVWTNSSQSMVNVLYSIMARCNKIPLNTP